MDSDSSCTYKDLVSDYMSTQDSKSWSVGELRDSPINYALNCTSVPILLQDKSLEAQESTIPTIDNLQIEEMLIEPLFYLPASCLFQLQSVFRIHKDTLFVSMSTYGIKYLAFTIPGCLLCQNKSTSKLYVPQRILKKVVYDCKPKGVECDFDASNSKNLYHEVFLPGRLQPTCQDICRNSEMKQIKSALTPMLQDGMTRYCPISITMYIVLDSNRKLQSPTGSGDTIIFKEKRTIQVLVLDIIKS